MVRAFPLDNGDNGRTFLPAIFRTTGEPLNNLTVNLGLRYEAHTPWVEAHDLQDNFDLVTGQLLAPNCSKVNLGTAPITCQQTAIVVSTTGTYGAKNFQPRIGFAWTPIIASAGRRYSAALSASRLIWKARAPTCASPSIRLSPRLKRCVQYNNVALAGHHDRTGIGSRGLGQRSVCRCAGPSLGSACAARHHSAVERDRAAAVRQQRYHPGRLCGPARDAPDGSHALPAKATAPEQCMRHTALHRAERTSSPAIRRSSRTFPRYRARRPWAASNYHALQAVFQKRYSSGLQYQVAYTLSRCMTDNSGYYGNWGAPGSPGESVLPEPVRSRELIGPIASSTPSICSAATRSTKFRSAAARSLAMTRIGPWMQLPEAGRLLRLFPSTPASRWRSTISAAIRRELIHADCVRIAGLAQGKFSDGKQRFDRREVHRLPVV